MFVDELTIEAEAGRGGNGVVRWRQEKFVDKGGPSGGNGGKGGDVYMRAVRDLGLLSRYTGEKVFKAGNGEAGAERSRYGKNGADVYIEVPVGSLVTNLRNGRTHLFASDGYTEKILQGGKGGLGNEYFKSSTNRTPEQSTEGKSGEKASFRIELSLVVDAGLIGLPNAGKSTLLNALTMSKSRVGAYPFTTTEPHLGDFYGYILADIPGLIEGAAEGKGLGHKFLRHITKTNMLLHCISLEYADCMRAYNEIRTELGKYDSTLLDKHEWIILTKVDLVPTGKAHEEKERFLEAGLAVFVVSATTGEGLAEFGTALSQHFKAR